MEIVVVYLLKALVLPPGINFLSMLIGMYSRKRCQGLCAKISSTIFFLGFFSLWALSTPWIATSLAALTEKFPAIPPRPPSRGVQAGPDRWRARIDGQGRHD